MAASPDRNHASFYSHGYFLNGTVQSGQEHRIQNVHGDLLEGCSTDKPLTARNGMWSGNCTHGPAAASELVSFDCVDRHGPAHVEVKNSGPNKSRLLYTETNPAASLSLDSVKFMVVTQRQKFGRHGGNAMPT